MAGLDDHRRIHGPGLLQFPPQLVSRLSQPSNEKKLQPTSRPTKKETEPTPHEIPRIERNPVTEPKPCDGT
jgi:hypothetical protein